MRRSSGGMCWIGALVVAGMLATAGCDSEGTKSPEDSTSQPDTPESDKTGEDSTDLGSDIDTPDVCAANTQFEVGMGLADITGPAADAGLMGYVVPAQKSAGLYMRQWAKALVVVSPCNGKRVLFVVLDTQAIFQDIHQEVLRELAKKYGDLYTAQNVVLTATHSHSVPGGASRSELYTSPPVNGFYNEALAGITQGTLAAIDQAHTSLQPGTIKLAVGSLPGASVNRAPDSFAKNPQELQDLFPNKVDETNTVLRVESASGQLIGMVDFFGIHTTSVGAKNLLVGPDNKGLAAWWFQREMAGRDNVATPFVAAFSNTNAGDISPNVDGFSFEMKDGFKDYKDMEKSAKKQYEAAMELFDSASDTVTGGVDYRMQYIHFNDYAVNKEFCDGTKHTTCDPGAGYSMLAGGTNDWPVLEDARYVTCEVKKGQGCTECQGEKPVLINMTEVDPPKVPLTVPFSVIRIGQLAFVALPFEVTTVAGYKIRTAIKQVLAPKGVTHTLTVGYSNGYNSYMVTRDEYSIQNYEGGFTLYGPWSNAAAAQIATGLAEALANDQPVEMGTPPRDLEADVPAAKHWNDFDEVPEGTEFGQIAVDVPQQVYVGDAVTATFWAAHLSNDFLLGKSFLTIERKAGDNWVVEATDDNPNTKLYWGRVDCKPNTHCSQSREEWTIPEGTTPGTYRIGYEGVWKKPDGTLVPFTGVSSEFLVSSVG